MVYLLAVLWWAVGLVQLFRFLSLVEKKATGFEMPPLSTSGMLKMLFMVVGWPVVAYKIHRYRNLEKHEAETAQSFNGPPRGMQN
jgi:hypothetical protein